jgi:sugar (pentulose or hexulose) kinase
MSAYLGVDVGTTSITAVVLDRGSQQVIAHEVVENNAEVTSAEDRARGRSEWDIGKMTQTALRAMAAAACASSPGIAAIGVTGQQHGMVPLDAAGQPVGPFIGWQDGRCQEPLEDGHTTIEQMLARGGEGFEHSGCVPATGYMASTLFWLAERALVPERAVACFAPDYVVSRLCDTRPVTDPTNAAGAGVYHVAEGRWNTELIGALGLRESQFPPVRPSCEVAGHLCADASQLTGLPEGIPVAVGCGDNQASFAGSVADHADSVLVNIGTGGQISAFVEEPMRGLNLDLRPFLQNGFLVVGAGLCGGRSYRALREFMRRVGEDVFGLAEMPQLYDRLTELAEHVPPGADGLRCEPIFAGTRREPGRRARWEGMSEASFTPGHMARALLEGLAEQFELLYQEMLDAGVERRGTLVGSGNGIRRNRLLREILAQRFGLPLHIARHTEEAAVGAALTAAVAVGECPDIGGASRAFISYAQD